ncbi:hypothetical protein Taro_036196 [Colocasia esculenta]|uniref:Pentatricopeptide repeat-containing protein n=1 Tax=Colocasia esculenta TaxID=4460 RepID=A0A843W7S4_COLES|nr:hypothetical protein [Colocasia esculenta]
MFSCHALKKTNPLRCLFPAGACPPASPGRQLSSAPHAAARTHGRMLKVGAADDTYTWNTILTSYARWVGIAEARKLFDEMSARDAVTWNAMIAAEVSRGGHEGAWDLFGAMMSSGLPFDQYTCGSVLKSVAGSGHLRLGRQFHCLIVKVGLDGNVFAGSALVDMYSKCGSMDDADSVFMLMPERNMVSWNAMINGHVQAGDHAMAFHLLDQMEREGVGPNEATFSSILSLVDRPAFCNLVLQIHGKIIKYGWAMDTIAYNAAITAYAQTGATADALKIFLEMDGIRDLVTWNSMLAAYACDGLAGAAIKLFTEMQRLGIRQDMYTYTSVISACFEQEQHTCGRALHSLAVKWGLEGRIPVSNSLIAMYIKSDHRCSMEDAVRCFDVMDFRDNVSWNSILTGLSQSDLSEEAMKFFRRMQCACLQIDHYAFSAALRSCSDLAVLQLGCQVHSLLHKSGFSRNDFVVSSLIYMYSKSGVIDDARRAFDESSKDSSVTWNSIIFGYAQHGQGHNVLKLFNVMQELKVKPDHVTFVAILSACSHIGLVEEGRKFLESMEPIYGIQLRMEHYACGVDLFGRSGHLEEAKKLIDSMSFEPDSTVWKPLLGACRIHRDMELGTVVARQLLLLEPEEHSTYVILSNMYAASGRWSDRALVQRTMKEGEIRKVPGWSWIEVKNKVHAFNAEDRSHPEVEEIYEKVEELMVVISMMDAGEDFDLHLHSLDATYFCSTHSYFSIL